MYRVKFKDLLKYIGPPFDTIEDCEAYIEGRLSMLGNRRREEYHIFRITEVEIERVPVTTYIYREKA